MSALELSAVIAAHNTAAHLSTCLAHLEQQTLAAARYEVVAVDAGSVDGTAELLEAHRGGAPVRTRVLRVAGPELIPALNAGIQSSEGRIVLLLSPEVLAAPGLLAAHVEAHADGTAPVVGIGAVPVHPQLNPRRLTRWALDAAAESAGIPARTPGYLDVRSVNVSLPRVPLIEEGGLDARFTDPDLAAAELVFRLGRRGLRPIDLPAASAYLWLAAHLAEERVRAYQRGYSLPLLAELTDAAEVRLRHPMRGGPVRAFLDGLLLRFSSEAWSDGDGQDDAWTGMHRRFLALHEARGWRDATRGRPPRPGG